VAAVGAKAQWITADHPLNYPFFGRVFHDDCQRILASGKGRSGKVGEAESYLFDAAELVEFAVKWLERMFGGRLRT
jgi:aminoglycoside N3'-acetyltransferase